ncbi:MAG: hypothetical protein OEZ02_03120 [Anaerolineae bacterium]|nr:hypothetical protein [Anaerolineae bacterium]
MQTYDELFGRAADFRVRYRWLGQPGQRRPQRLFQHIRSDFSYAEFEENGEVGNCFMIYPEFEAEDGSAFPDEHLVPPVGTAGMWINVDKMRDFHRERIKVGVKGFMVSGAVKLAEVEVIEVISLSSV